ncbi:MAG TPA: MarR family transcriptional regulator [Actinocatenispora sp.]
MSEDSLVRAWHELRDRYAAVSCALERALQDGHGIGVSEYDALELLHERGKESYRAQELVEALPLSQSAASRLVARLERQGLVSRGMCEMDRRGIMVCLTDAGRERFRAARPTHQRILADTLAAV